MAAGTCENCWRERDDLFLHAQEERFYCADIFRCEARFLIREARGDFDGWPESDYPSAHVRRPTAKAVGDL